MVYIVHGILQARMLEWVAFPFSRGSSQPRDWTEVSHIAGGFSTSWARREAQESWSGHLCHHIRSVFSFSPHTQASVTLYNCHASEVQIHGLSDFVLILCTFCQHSFMKYYPLPVWRIWIIHYPFLLFWFFFSCLLGAENVVGHAIPELSLVGPNCLHNKHPGLS